MDINYLLLLQEFRIRIDDALTPFMEMVSLFAVTYLVIIPAYIYWCIDKRAGLYSLASYSTCVAINAVVKLTACVYRPWIREPRILPAGDSIATATGYSFPSGHTATAVSLYGSLAVSAWKRWRWVSVLCALCIVATGFSRNYLGVHTPQDVAAALLIGILTLWGMAKLFAYVRAHPEKENAILAAGIVAGVIGLLYITHKAYPMEYVNGELLADPQKMMKEGFADLGLLMGFCAARLVEKTWIRFHPRCTKPYLLMGLVGAAIAVCLIEFTGGTLRAAFGLHWGTFLKSVVLMFYIVALWPLVMKRAAG